MSLFLQIDALTAVVCRSVLVPITTLMRIRMRIRIRLITLMRVRIRIQIFNMIWIRIRLFTLMRIRIQILASK
jgi:hypothetical protein